MEISAPKVGTLVLILRSGMLQARRHGLDMRMRSRRTPGGPQLDSGVGATTYIPRTASR
eukprot:SAG25_NODE_14155_length_258_cov_0.798742_1_plen_58_part_10